MSSTPSKTRTKKLQSNSVAEVDSGTDLLSETRSLTVSDSCSSRDSIVFLFGTQLESKKLFLENNSTDDLLLSDQLPYTVIATRRLLAVLTFNPRFVLRAPLSIHSDVFTVQVLNVTQAPVSPALRIVLLFDARPNLNLMNVRTETILTVQVALSIGTFPACQLLNPSTIGEQIQVIVTPPLEPLAQTVTCSGTVGGVTSSSLGNPTPALNQAMFLSLVDIAACAFSDVEPLDLYQSMFGMEFGSDVGKQYRGAVTSFIICMVAALVALVIGTRIYTNYHDTTYLETAALVHSPSLLVIPFSILVEGVALSCVSLLRLSLGLTDVMLGVIGLLSCSAFVVFVYAVCSPRWGFCCVLVERELHHQNHVPKAIEVLFKFTEPQMRWVDASDDKHKRRYLLFFNDFKWRWYCAVELAAAFINGLLQGIRINDPAVCVKTAASLVALHTVMLVICALYRPCSALSDTFFLLAAKTFLVCSAAVTLASTLREDDSLLRTVLSISTWGSIVEDIHVIVMILSLIGKAYIGWGSHNKNHHDDPASVVKVGGDVELSALFVNPGDGRVIQGEEERPTQLDRFGAPRPHNELDEDTDVLRVRQILEHLESAAIPTAPRDGRLADLVMAVCLGARRRRRLLERWRRSQPSIPERK